MQRLLQFLLCFFCLISIVTQAKLSKDLRDGADQLEALAQDGKTLDKIVTQISSMYDQILAKKKDIHDAMEKNKSTLQTIEQTRKTIDSNTLITSTLKQNLFNSLDSLKKALNNLNGVLNTFMTKIDQTQQDKTCKMTLSMSGGKVQAQLQGGCEVSSLQAHVGKVKNDILHHEVSGHILTTRMRKLASHLKDIKL